MSHVVIVLLKKNVPKWFIRDCVVDFVLLLPTRGSYRLQYKIKVCWRAFEKYFVGIFSSTNTGDHKMFNIPSDHIILMFDVMLSRINVFVFIS